MSSEQQNGTERFIRGKGKELGPEWAMVDRQAWGGAALSERAREETRDKVAARPFYSQAHTWQQVMKSQVAKQTRGGHLCVTTETSPLPL